MKNEETWGYSHDQETYRGFFETREEAILLLTQFLAWCLLDGWT
jgi:hypothetical protein